MKKEFYFRIVTLLVLVLCISCQLVQGQQTDSTQSVTDTPFTNPVDSLSLESPDSISKPTFILLDTIRYRFIGDGNFTRGNVNRSLVVLRAEALFSGPKINVATNPRFTYGKQNGILAERDSYVDLFVDILKKKRTYAFGLGVIENSNLRRIVLRKMAGAGVGFRLLRSKSNELSLTDAILFESTNFREIPTVTTLRNSFRIKGKHAMLQDKVRFNHLTFIQPALNDFSNWRWNTIISVELPLNKWVTLRTSFENSYESVVEATRKHNDSRVTFGISVGNK